MSFPGAAWYYIQYETLRTDLDIYREELRTALLTGDSSRTRELVEYLVFGNDLRTKASLPEIT